jgi:hypothetical protein
MGIAVSAVLIAVGAVFAFVPDDWIDGTDLKGPGIVLMLVGCLGLAVTVVIWTPSRRPDGAGYAPTSDQPAGGQHVTSGDAVGQRDAGQPSAGQTDDPR